MNLDEILAALSGMPEKEKQEAINLAKKSCEGKRFIPNPGPQTEAYFSEADELFFGGGAGGGKSRLICGLAIDCFSHSHLFRREARQVVSLMDEVKQIVGHSTGLNHNDKIWKMPEGTIIEFAGLKDEADKENWQGRAAPFKAFDEITQFTESQYRYIIGWNRSARGERCRVIATGNPPTTAQGQWVVKYWAPWLDKSHPNPAKPGELRWFTTIAGEDTEVEGKGPHGYDQNGLPIYAKSRTFIPSRLEDNPDLMASGYAATLEAMPKELRDRLRHGSFDVDFEDDEWQAIPSDWIKQAQARWTETPPPIPMTAIAADVAQGGCFDDKTEILTSEGWKFFADISGAEKVLTLDGNVSKWGDITEIHKYKFYGFLNTYERAGINFSITDNHNLVFSTRNSDEWKIARYDSLPKIFRLKRTSEWLGESPATISFSSECAMPNGGVRVKKWSFDFKDWCLLVGWFVSEGCAFKEKRKNGRWRVNISQNKGEKYNAIANLLDRMGIKWISPKSRSSLEFSINSIGSHLAEYCGVHAKNKKIPDYIKNASSESISCFLESYRMGDGTINGSGVVSYTTTSKKLADDIQEVLFKLGKCGKLYQKEFSGSVFKIGSRACIRKNTTYTINERTSRDAYIDKSKVEETPYSGFVYCVSTPLKTICVRRGGLPMWSGNSDRTAIQTRYDWWYSRVESFKGVDTPDGPSVAALIVPRMRDRCRVIIDAGGGYGGDTLTQLAHADVDCYGFKGGSGSNSATREGMYRFKNFRAQAVWQFREALDPTYGSKIALPPDPELVADLTAYRFEITGSGHGEMISMRPKDEMREMLGRSPDKGDCTIMLSAANITGMKRPKAAQERRDLKLRSFHAVTSNASLKNRLRGKK